MRDSASTGAGRRSTRFRRALQAAALPGLGILLYFAFWPVDADPEAWRPPPTPGRTGVYAPNRALARVERLPAGGIGPEDVAVGPDGAVYAGLKDGRIVRLPPGGGEARPFADTGGRPLGLRFDAQGRLYVADARRGLLRVERDGTVAVLATEQGGRPFGLADDLDVARDGTVYFTDATSKLGPGGSILAVLEHHPLGRLLAYDPARGDTRLLLDDLYFANGVALAPDESYVLVVETSSYRVRRLWLRGPRQGATDVFIDNLPAFPDGISFNGRDTFWVSLVSPRNGLLDRLHPHPELKKALMRLPDMLRPGPEPYGFVLGLNERGAVVHNLQDPTGQGFAYITNAVEHEGTLYFGSLELSEVGRLRLATSPSSLTTRLP